MSVEKEQEQIVKALQKYLNEAIKEHSPPETIATLSKAVRQAADALKSLKSS